MSRISDILQSEYANEYGNEYDLSVQRQFSRPKIYMANGDLRQRWYVYFSYRNPETNKLKRQPPIYANANRYKTKEERMAILTVYSQMLYQLLKRGYSPYRDNADLFQKEHQTAQDKNSVNDSAMRSGPGRQMEDIPKEEKGMPLDEALDFDMDLKKRSLKDSSMISYKSHLKVFREWLEKNHPKLESIKEVDRPIVLSFLNHVLKTTSARNRNNYRTSLSSMFQTLENNDIVKSNFIKKIVVLKTNPKRNRTYTKEQHEEIFDYLEKEDSMLLLFIKFVSYNFLRPIEVCRLRVRDIDLVNKKVSFEAKNSPRKTKIIPKLLLDDLPDLSKMGREDSLFTPDGIGGQWELSMVNKRNYFSKRFKKVVKDKFGLGNDYGLYSFRHTFITKLYRAFLKDYTDFEAKSRLMLITGHKSMKALENYLRDIDAELPDDYSDMLTD